MGSSCDDTDESDESSSILKDALAAVKNFDGRGQVCTQGRSWSLAVTLKKEDSS